MIHVKHGNVKNNIYKLDKKLCAPPLWPVPAIFPHANPPVNLGS